MRKLVNPSKIGCQKFARLLISFILKHDGELIKFLIKNCFNYFCFLQQSSWLFQKISSIYQKEKVFKSKTDCFIFMTNWNFITKNHNKYIHLRTFHTLFLIRTQNVWHLEVLGTRRFIHITLEIEIS